MDEAEDDTTMAKRCWSPDFHSMNICLWHTALVLLLALHVCTCGDTNTIVLNSCERCSSSVEYEVSTGVDYLVTVSSAPGPPCSWECKARVYSGKNSSWLCLSQVGIVSQINDSNGILSVYDSRRNDNAIFHLKYYLSTWHHREDCRQTEFLDFYLRKVKSSRKLDFKKLRINFRVLDIESTKRVVYLDGTYCTTGYKLLNSQISMYNQPDETEAITYEHTLVALCGVPVEIVDTPETQHKRICFYYMPSDHVNCSSNWSFSVSVGGYSTSPASMIYTLNCAQNRSRETHAWCAEVSIRKVTVIFQRNSNVPKSVEQPRMFRFLVLDHNGSAESLMAEKTNAVKELLVPAEEEEEVVESNNIMVICILVSIAAVVLVIVAVVLYSRRRCLSLLLYGPVHNPANPTAC